MTLCRICKRDRETKTVLIDDDEEEMCDQCIEFGTMLIGRPPVYKEEVEVS